jgi:hypothetical protein
VRGGDCAHRDCARLRGWLRHVGSQPELLPARGGRYNQHVVDVCTGRRKPVHPDWRDPQRAQVRRALTASCALPPSWPQNCLHTQMTWASVSRLFRNYQPAPSEGNAQILRIGHLVGLGDDARPPSVSSAFEGAVRVRALSRRAWACRMDRVRLCCSGRSAGVLARAGAFF